MTLSSLSDMTTSQQIVRKRRGSRNKQKLQASTLSSDPTNSSKHSLRSNQAAIASQAPTGASSSWLEARKYAVLIDAGSSGSRMQVYSWKDPKLDRALRENKGMNLKVFPKVEKGTWEGSGMDWTHKVEPGISSFGDHPYDLPNYLEPLMRHAEEIVPPSAWAETPIYVMATAGMRLLPQKQRQDVLTETCRYIREHTRFKISDADCSDQVQVISGEEEGLLGWISVNYLMDGFHIRDSKPLISGEADIVQGKSTFGFLDMGGASTQIAFEPSKNALEADGPATEEQLSPVSLRMLDGTQVEHKVFVTTFLGYGTNQARERFVHQLQLNGTVPTTKLGGSVGKPVQDPCLPKGLEISNPTDGSIIGTGSFTSCLEATHPLLDKSAPCSKPPCLFHGVHVPAIDFSVNHFIGVSEYWYSSNDVFGLGGVYDFVSFQKAAVEFCGKPWSQLTSMLEAGNVFGPQVDQNRLQMQCFKAAWMVTVLHDGIGLPRIVDSEGKGDGKAHVDEAMHKADKKNLFQSVDDVDGFSISWMLGKAVLEATNSIPPAPETLASPFDELNKSESALGSWDPFKASWPITGEGSAFPPTIQSGHKPVSPLPFLAIVVFVLVLFTCLCTRGRGPRASRRRAAIREWLPPPFGSLGGLVCASQTAARGDYVLAAMEEAAEGESVGYWSPNDKQADLQEYSPTIESEHAFSSEASSEGVTGIPRSRFHSRPQSNSSGILQILTWPVRRMTLAALSVQPASLSTPKTKRNKRDSNIAFSRPGSKSRKLAVRRGVTTPSMIRASHPGSPSSSAITAASTISRPASRTSSRAPTPTLGHRAKLASAATWANASVKAGAASLGATGPHVPTTRPGLFAASLSRTSSVGDFANHDASTATAPTVTTPSASASVSASYFHTPISGASVSVRSPSRVASPAPHLTPMSEVRSMLTTASLRGYLAEDG